MLQRPGAREGERDLFQSLARALYLAAGLVVLLWFAYEIQRVLLLLLLALILALALNAPVSWLERRKVSRGVATLLVFLGVVAVAGLLGWLVVPRLLDEMPALMEQVPELIERLTERAAVLLEHPQIAQQGAQAVNWLEAMVGNLWRRVDALVASVLLTLFVVALVLYLVADPRPALRTYICSMPPRHREPAARAFARASEMVVGWVVSNAIMGGIKATASFLVLTYLEIPGAVIWSVLALFAALIPRLGFYIMAIPPVLTALAVDPAYALYLALFYWALSEFLGNFVAPRVQGEMMDLHPAYVLFMTLAMAYAFGLIGVLIAPPVAGFLKAFYDEFYLARQPDDPEMEERVEAMLARRTGEGDRSRS
jgi:putative permease